MSTSAGKAVYNILSNDAAVTAIVGTRIYPVVARQQDQEPYVVYSVVNDIPHDTKTGVSRVDFVRVQFNMVAADYSQLEDLSAAIRSALDRAAMQSYAGVELAGVKFLSENDGFSDAPELRLKIADYQLRIAL